MDKITRFADMIKECNNIVFFGGAGVSTESGVKDYRSEDGIYNTVKDYGVAPEKILSHEFFFSNTADFYDFYRKFFLGDVEPNDAHKALAELERRGKVSAVITQNVDSLHQRAGSNCVVELHGSGRIFACSKCKKEVDSAFAVEEIKNGNVPTCKHCGNVMKPRVVLYGEQLFEGVAESAINYILNADMLIVGGTSLSVYPAASFLEYFEGKYIVVINKSETALHNKADLIINDSIGKVFNEVMKLL